MFIKNSIFKKLLKEAYTGSGLHVACTTNNENTPIYAVSGGRWILWVGKDWITKEMKAALIENCGDLPALGEACKFTRDEEPQHEFDNTYTHLLEDCFKSDRELLYTDLLTIQSGSVKRVLRDEERSIYFLDQFTSSVICRGAIDHESGEKELRGPFANQDGTAMYWNNNAGVLMIGATPIPKEEKEFWAAAGQIL